MKRLLQLLAIFGFIFTACEGGLGNEDNGETPATPQIEISQQNIEVEFESNEYSIDITSPYSWRAISHDDWLIVNTKTGIAGTNELKFSVERNEETETRGGTIVVKNEDYNLIAELYVIQKAFVPELTVEPELLNFVAEGGEQEIVIAANFEYEVSISVDWLSTEKSDKGIKVTALASDVLEERSTGITISNAKYEITRSINITQGSFVPEITIEPESLTFAPGGGTHEVVIAANFEYEIVVDADWLSVERCDKGMKVSARASGIEDRAAEITITNEKFSILKSINVTQEKNELQLLWAGWWEVTSPRTYTQQMNFLTEKYEESWTDDELIRPIEIVDGASLDASLEGYAVVYGWDGKFLYDAPAIGVYNDNKIELINEEIVYEDAGQGIVYQWLAQSEIPTYGEGMYMVGGDYPVYTFAMDAYGAVTIEAYKGQISTGDKFTVCAFTIWPVVGEDIYTWIYTESAYTFSGEKMTAVKAEGATTSAKLSANKNIKIMHKIANQKFVAKTFTAARFVK